MEFVSYIFNLISPPFFPYTVPDTINLLGVYNMDPLADYPPQVRGRAGGIRDTPITEQNTVACYTQTTYDDDVKEGNEYFAIALTLQHRQHHPTVMIEPSLSSAIVRIIDNDSKYLDSL